jgi:hypothetical protein
VSGLLTVVDNRIYWHPDHVSYERGHPAHR